MVSLKAENLRDVIDLARGRIPAEQVRSVEFVDALVRPSLAHLALPKALLAPLGLEYRRTCLARMGSELVEVRVFGTAKLTVQGRECPVDVTELPDGCPVLIGQIPLEAMDFVVDLPGRQVVGNPAHGGEQVIELY